MERLNPIAGGATRVVTTARARSNARGGYRGRAKGTLTTADVVDVAQRLFVLLRQRNGGRVAVKWSETDLLPIIYGLLGGALDPKFVRRETWTRAGSGRVDFKFMGKAPTLLEIAVRGKKYANELYESKNRPELNKLARKDSQKATRRILLLLDPSGHDPFDRKKLIENYASAPRVRGRGERRRVRVVYAHPDIEPYSFHWPVMK